MNSYKIINTTYEECLKKLNLFSHPLVKDQSPMHTQSILEIEFKDSPYDDFHSNAATPKGSQGDAVNLN